MLAPRAASVAEYLAKTTKYHGESEVPSSSSGQPGDHVGHQQHDEQGGEGRVGSKVEDVAIETRLANTIGRVGMAEAELSNLVHRLGVETVFGCAS